MRTSLDYCNLLVSLYYGITFCSKFGSTSHTVLHVTCMVDKFLQSEGELFYSYLYLLFERINPTLVSNVTYNVICFYLFQSKVCSQQRYMILKIPGPYFLRFR